MIAAQQTRNTNVRISVFQALTLLTEKYPDGSDFQSIMQLYLVGVRNRTDADVLTELLQDPCFEDCDIATEKRDINEDPVRRYFESQLCYETIVDSLDEFDLSLLKLHLHFVLKLSDKPSDSFFENRGRITEQRHLNSFLSFKPNMGKKGLTAELLWEQRQEKLFWLEHMTLSCPWVIGHKAFPIDLHGVGLFSSTDRGRVTYAEENSNVRPYTLGIMKSYMPLPVDDVLFSSQPSNTLRVVDVRAYIDYSVVPEMMFLSKVTPFCSSISGSMLCLLQTTAVLNKKAGQIFVYFAHPEQLILLFKLWMAFMLHIGTHSLDEMMRVIELPEVREEFKDMPLIRSLTLDSLFKYNNATAFTNALYKTQKYNHTILCKKKLHHELFPVSSLVTAYQPVQHPLHIFSEKGILSMVKTLIECNPEVINIQDINGLTPLHRAMCSSSSEQRGVINVLLKNGADADAVDKKGDTALLHASNLHKCEVAKVLLDHGADVNIKNDDGKTALMVASKRGRMDIVRLLLDKKAEVNAIDKNGDTALLHACDSYQWDVAKALLEHSADVNIKGDNNKTALMVASKRDSLDIIRLLLDKKAVVNAIDKNGDTALLHACDSHKWDVVKVLLEHGTDVNIKNYDSKTALIVASKKGRMDIVRLLLDKKADVNAIDKNGDTALIHTSISHNCEVAKVLLEHGADVNIKNDDSKTALMVAAKNGRLDIVRLLLDKKADVNAKDHKGRASLFYACKSDHCEVVKILIEHDADVNIKDHDGTTALMAAGSLDIVRLLLDNKADVDAIDDKGRSVLRHASGKGNLMGASLLVFTSIKQNPVVHYGLAFILLMMSVKPTLDNTSKGAFIANNAVLVACLVVISSVVSNLFGLKTFSALSTMSLFSDKQKKHEFSTSQSQDTIGQRADLIKGQ